MEIGLFIQLLVMQMLQRLEYFVVLSSDVSVIKKLEVRMKKLSTREPNTCRQQRNYGFEGLKAHSENASDRGEVFS